MITSIILFKSKIEFVYNSRKLFVSNLKWCVTFLYEKLLACLYIPICATKLRQGTTLPPYLGFASRVADHSGVPLHIEQIYGHIALQEHIVDSRLHFQTQQVRRIRGAQTHLERRGLSDKEERGKIAVVKG